MLNENDPDLPYRITALKLSRRGNIVLGQGTKAAQDRLKEEIAKKGITWSELTYEADVDATLYKQLHDTFEEKPEPVILLSLSEIKEAGGLRHRQKDTTDLAFERFYIGMNFQRESTREALHQNQKTLLLWVDNKDDLSFIHGGRALMTDIYTCMSYAYFDLD